MMNQIEEKKKYEVDADVSTKQHYNNILYLTNHQVSWLTASIVLLSFFIFIAGYFLGQRKALEQFNQSIDQEVFSDHIYSNACALYDQQQSESAEVQKDEAEEAIIEQPEDIKKNYYAQLIGFGTSRAAYRFADRLQQRNMPVKVKERHSKTAQGKKIIWYQVITDQFSNKEDLLTFVQKIKKEERLNDIRILAC